MKRQIVAGLASAGLALAMLVVPASAGKPAETPPPVADAALLCQTGYGAYGFDSRGECIQHVAQGGELVQPMAITVTPGDWLFFDASYYGTWTRLTTMTASNLVGTTAMWDYTYQYSTYPSEGSTQKAETREIYRFDRPSSITNGVATSPYTVSPQCSQYRYDTAPYLNFDASLFTKTVTVTDGTGRSVTWTEPLADPCVDAPFE